MLWLYFQLGLSVRSYFTVLRLPFKDRSLVAKREGPLRHFDKHRFDNYTDWLDRETRKRNRAQGKHVGRLGEVVFQSCDLNCFLKGRSKSEVWFPCAKSTTSTSPRAALFRHGAEHGVPGPWKCRKAN